MMNVCPNCHLVTFGEHGWRFINKYNRSRLCICCNHAVDRYPVEHLPRIHGDPFDRLLICQAKAENMILVTADENIVKYDVQVYWSPDDSD